MTLINYKNNFHVFVDECRKQGKTLRECWEMAEKEHEKEVGASKFSSMESFKNAYYRYVHKQKTPKKGG
ncbi:MAG: hypothetical protein EKK63_15930 [Acinetobacter sp.]|uniref:hypothetical protein n=1 Tax=Acinetobacter sp. TaxID=472 RepID=UPI000F919531|nr:hypothetical protein [Acinetobacter sp.]RUP37057.1 MAG: hypothetical protein EKK63_15930 [Acinetobacter sp.]